MAEKIYIYDTTLRDGTQGEEISFSVVVNSHLKFPLVVVLKCFIRRC